MTEYGGDKAVAEYKKGKKFKQGQVLNAIAMLQGAPETASDWDYLDEQVARQQMRMYNLPGTLDEWKAAATKEREGLMTK